MVSLKKQIQLELSEINRGLYPSEKEILKEEEIQHLPAPLRKWMKLSGAVGMEKAKTVWLEQKFQLKLKPGQQKWNTALARQIFTPDNPAFIWALKMKPAPFVTILGRDKFIDGKGEIQMKLNGMINLGRNSGKKIDEGTLQRYLGETVWFPSAMISNNIKWEQPNEHAAKATMTFKGTRGSGTFHFNSEGFFEKFSAWRYKDNTADSERLEWIIKANEYSEINGIKIPVKLDATWMLETGPWIWCKLEVTNIKYNMPQFPQKLF